MLHRFLANVINLTVKLSFARAAESGIREYFLMAKYKENVSVSIDPHHTYCFIGIYCFYSAIVPRAEE
jgi:hypothetical protein